MQSYLTYKIKNKLELDKNGFNPSKIILTVFHKIVNRLKNETTEMYLFEMEFQSADTLAIAENIEIINTPEKLLDFVKARALEDNDLIEEKYFDQIIERFQKGGWCYAYKIENKISSIVFISPTEEFSTAINYIFKMPSKTIGVVDGYTLQEYRGKGIYKSIYDFAFKDIVNKGFVKGWFWIMPHNLVTLYLHKKVGVKNVIKKISLIQQFGLRWHKEENIKMDIDEIIDISKDYNQK